MRLSGKALATASLISQLVARSMPSGFSSPIRARSPVSPALSSPRMVGSNRLGAVDRKIASCCAVPTFSPSAAKLAGSVTLSGW